MQKLTTSYKTIKAIDPYSDICRLRNSTNSDFRGLKFFTFTHDLNLYFPSKLQEGIKCFSFLTLLIFPRNKRDFNHVLFYFYIPLF